MAELPTLESERATIAERLSLLEKAIDRKNQHRIKLMHALRRKDEQIKQAREQEAAKAPKEKVFLDCSASENMGLHNKPCPNPYAFCRLHGVWLAYDQVRNRRCVMRLCKHLADGPEETEATDGA